MASASSSRRRRAAPAGLWFLAALPVFCVISYPGVTMARVTLWAGMCHLLVVVSYLAALVGLGSFGGPRKTDPGEWKTPWPATLGSAMAVALAALALDRVNGWTAALCGLTTAAGIVFTWLFLPWLVADAEAGSGPPRAARGRRSPGLPLLQGELLAHGRKLPTASRSGLGFLLVFGFLLLGLGAAWSRGEQWAPSPTYWLIALTLAALLLMFSERLHFFTRSARDGNLLMAPQADLRWATAALLALFLAALVAALPPWRPPLSRVSEARVGSAVDRTASTLESAGARAEQLVQQAVYSAGQALGALGAPSGGLLLLWLLLLLLFAASVLVWVFSRTRAAHCILAAVAWALHQLLRAWRQLLAAVRRIVPRRSSAVGEGEPAQETDTPADPLFDVFEDPDTLARLSAREIAIRAYHLVLNFAEMLGHGRRPGQTPFEFARALTRAVPSAEHAILGLTWGYSGAMYGAENAELPSPGAVRDSWHHIFQALTEKVSPEDLALRRQAYLAARGLQRTA